MTKDNTLNILSIDFDYFQDVTEEQLRYYPNPVDVPNEISEALWKLKYKQHKKELENIEINSILLEKVKTILKNQSNNIKVLVTDGHEKAFKFIDSNIVIKSINLYNIDLHHDIINSSEKLDCGNWISYLLRKYKVKVNWITRELSVKNCALGNLSIPWLNISTNIETAENKQFDMIFICRSDIWTPPHLDKYFNELKELCKDKFKNIRIEEDLIYERY